MPKSPPQKHTSKNKKKRHQSNAKRSAKPFNNISKEFDVFQLKISLKHIKPPIWRRILISSLDTFKDLHYTIQGFFRWQNFHLHEFSFRLEGKKNKHLIVSKSDMEENYASLSPTFTCENDVRLADIFPHKCKSLTYLYDFGDNWEHKIVLEKIFPGNINPHFLNPLCIKGKRTSPGEDFGGPHMHMGLLAEDHIFEQESHESFTHLITSVKITAAGKIIILNPTQSSDNLGKEKSLSSEGIDDELDEDLEEYYKAAADIKKNDVDPDILALVHKAVSKQGQVKRKSIQFYLDGFLSHIKNTCSKATYDKYSEEIELFTTIIDEDGKWVLQDEFNLDYFTSILPEFRTKTIPDLDFLLHMSGTALFPLLISYIDPDFVNDFESEPLHLKDIPSVFSKFVNWLASKKVFTTAHHECLKSRLDQFRNALKTSKGLHSHHQIDQSSLGMPIHGGLSLLDESEELQAFIQRQITSFISNGNLSDDLKPFLYPSYEDLSPSELAGWRKLFQVADELHQLSPWEIFTETDRFAIQDPKTKTNGYCCLTGRIDDPFRVTIFRDADGLDGLHYIRNAPVVDNEEVYPFGILLKMNCLSLSFESKEYVDPPDWDLYSALKIKRKRNQPYLIFRDHTSGYAPWFFTIDQVHCFTIALTQVIYVVRRMKEDPKYLEKIRTSTSNSILVRRQVTIKQGKKRWRNSMEPCTLKWNEHPYHLFDYIPVSRLLNNPSLFNNEIRAILRSAVKSKQKWTIFDTYIPSYIQDDLKEECVRPSVLFELIILENSAEEVLAHEAGSLNDLAQKCYSTILEIITELNEIPSEIQVLTSKHVQFFQPICSVLGINLIQIQYSEEVESFLEFSRVFNSVLDEL